MFQGMSGFGRKLVFEQQIIAIRERDSLVEICFVVDRELSLKNKKFCESAKI